MQCAKLCDCKLIPHLQRKKRQIGSQMGVSVMKSIHRTNFNNAIMAF